MVAGRVVDRVLRTIPGTLHFTLPTSNQHEDILRGLKQQFYRPNALPVAQQHQSICTNKFVKLCGIELYQCDIIAKRLNI